MQYKLKNDVAIYAVINSVTTYRLSQLQCINVFILQLNSPYFSSKPPIQKEHPRSCFLQHRSVLEKPPNRVYLSAEYPFPHHLVPGTRKIS